jgi:hypothetical protein
VSKAALKELESSLEDAFTGIIFDERLAWT